MTTPAITRQPHWRRPMISLSPTSPPHWCRTHTVAHALLRAGCPLGPRFVSTLFLPEVSQ